MGEQKRIQKEIIKQTQEMGVDQRIVRSLSEMGFEHMTPIQEQTIPLLLSGKDVIGQAQTGTGKTAAFGIPLLQNTDPENKEVQAIVLCPTRELAIQAAEELRRFAKYMHGIKVLPVYGGQDITRQIKLLKNVQIIVGTPGRVMDHMRRHTLHLEHIRMLVLDEADEMLNMGFREDIENVLKDVPKERQTALFSATMPQSILDITHTYQKEDAEYIRVTPKELTIPLVKQYFYEVKREYKKEATIRLLDYSGSRRSLIFCNTKRMVDELAKVLSEKGYQVEGLHGDLTQAQRDRVMNGFRKGMIRILIATDVAARGIDVDDVEVVINYDVPQDNEYYVHRIGRTGRAGKTGTSHTLASGRELYRIHDIERMCRTRIEERRLPSVSDVTGTKVEKVLSQVTEICRTQSLDQMMPYVEKLIETQNITATELVAAFLKFHIGEEPEEIPEVIHRRRGRGGAERRDRMPQERKTGRSGKPQQGRKAARAGKEEQARKSVRTGKEEQKRKSARTGKAAGVSQETSYERLNQKQKVKPADVRADGSAVKRKRHDHTGENGTRKKLITGENKDYGYDTGSSAYRMREPLPGRALEIKVKEPVTPNRETRKNQPVSERKPVKEGQSAQEKKRKQTGFLFFKKK